MRVSHSASQFASRSVSLSLLVAGLSLSGLSMAHAAQYQADYKISYLGITVAKSSFKSTIEGNNYSLTGHLKTAGLVRAVEKSSGSTSIKGTLGKKGAVPSTYKLSYTSGKKAKSTWITFKGGNAVSTSNSPKTKKKGKWKEVTAKDLKSVVDPLSASLVRGNTPQEVCNRTIRFYDGRMRGDVKLSYAGQRPFSTDGFKGLTVHCSGRFIPVSGYNQNKKDIKWMRDNGRISLSFAKVDNSGLHAPVAAEVKTRLGKVRVRASRFVVTR